MTFLPVSDTMTLGAKAFDPMMFQDFFAHRRSQNPETFKICSFFIGENIMKHKMNLREYAHKLYLTRIFHNLLVLLKWMAFAALSGLAVGAISALFAKSLQLATGLRSEYQWLLYLLPAAGLVIAGLYRLVLHGNDRGTNLVISSLRSRGETPLRIAPLIFVSTFLTQLCGGSAGREGAALQIGGSLGNALSKLIPISEEDRHILIMCGMSAAFAAVFGTPLAAAIFSLEIVSVGIMYYAALVPCLLSALIASRLAVAMGVHPEQFTILSIPDLTLAGGLKTILLGVICAGASIVLCILLHKSADLLKKLLKNPFVRAAASGVLIIALTLLLGTRDYLGSGSSLIEAAIQEEKVFSLAFLLKILFTCITIGGGFKGGEIVPSFSVGATLGCVIGQLMSLSPSLCAAMGMVAVFSGVTNCPITAILISFELFGFQCAPYMFLVIAVSYSMSGYYGLYSDQTIVYSKYKASYINRNVNH